MMTYGFIQNDYEKSISRLSPASARELVNLIQHNTLLFANQVWVKRLLPEGGGDSMRFYVPDERDDLVAMLFKLSLTDSILEYSFGHVTEPEENKWAGVRDELGLMDVIYTRRTDDGTTNITDKVVEAVAERYT